MDNFCKTNAAKLMELYKMSIIFLISLVASYALLLMMAYSDLKTRTISNGQTFVFFLASISLLLVAFAAELLTLSQLIWHAGLFASALIICFILFGFGLMGGGDAKLIPSVVMICGSGYSVSFLFFMAIFGGLIAAIMLVRNKYSVQTSNETMCDNSMSANFSTKVPYGVAILLGASPVFFSILQMSQQGSYHVH